MILAMEEGFLLSRGPRTTIVSCSGSVSVRVQQVDVGSGVGREPCELARQEARRLRRVGARGAGGVRA